MITREKAQILADTYNVKVLGVETLHDNKSDEYIADYIRLKIRDDLSEQNVNVYLGNDYKIVENKEFYIESKIKNALYSVLQSRESTHVIMTRQGEFDMKILLELFYIFARIGLFTFGGGYAMISIIEDICVERKKWISHEEMMNMTVIAESTPGPIAINCATYVGYKLAGFWGATVATFGMVLPSFVVIFAISKFLDNFLEITLIAHAFYGIKIAVGILIFDAAITMIKKMKKKVLPRMIMACSFVVMMLVNIFSWSFSSINLMLAAGILSLMIFTVQKISKEKGGAGK